MEDDLGGRSYHFQSLSLYPAAPKYSLRGRPNLRMRSQGPGPGEYDIPSGRSVSVRFGSAQRRQPLNPRAQDAPGPGNYSFSPTVTLQRQPSWTMMARRGGASFIRKCETPGPGAYRLSPLSSTSFKFGRGMRSDMSRANNVPGPGLYELDHRYRDGFEKPRSLTMASRALSSPALHNRGWAIAASDLRLLSARAFVMGAGHDAGANYMVSLSKYPKGPKYTLTGRHGETAAALGSQSLAVPGPGRYEIPPADRTTKSRGAPKIRFGSAARFTNFTQTSIGPGQYNPNDPNCRRDAAPRFGTERRDGSMTARHDGRYPGPGAYVSIATSILPKAPAFTLRARCLASGALTARNATPGPGAYRHIRQNLVQNITFGKELRGGGDLALRERYRYPGPGMYSLVAKGTMGGPGSPRYTIRGKPQGSSLDVGEKKYVPGPGDYNADYRGFGY